MLKVVSLVMLILFLAAVGVAGWWFYDPILQQFQQPTPTPDLSSPTPVPLTEKHTVVLLQQRDSERRIVVCSPTNCQPSVPPDSVQANAVFDGLSWYRYRMVEPEKGRQPVRLLERVWVKDQHSEPIVEQTPLVQPRDLYISPDGKRVAYWLDNIDQPKEKLTELWVYDSEIGSTRLVVEKVKQDDVVSPVRWNRASTHVWFMVHPTKQDTKIVLAGVKPVERVTAFDQVSWNALEGIASFGSMDISLTGEDLAYIESDTQRSQLVIARKGMNQEYTTLNGTVPYMEWLPDGSLLYARQGQRDFTLWRVQGKTHRHVAQHDGVLRSARSDAEGQTVLLTVERPTGGTYVATVRLSDGYTVAGKDIPDFGGSTDIVQVMQENVPPQTQMDGISTTLSDEELVAFIEKELEAIVAEKNVTAKRIIMTDQANTLYVDYQQGVEDKRVLVTVRDALHPEWSIRGRYKQAQGDWKKIEGSGLADPVGTRVYEWEATVKQWIKKSG